MWDTAAHQQQLMPLVYDADLYKPVSHITDEKVVLLDKLFVMGDYIDKEGETQRPRISVSSQGHVQHTIYMLTVFCRSRSRIKTKVVMVVSPYLYCPTYS